MVIGKIQSKLAWFNEVSTGIGLVLGYIGYSLFWLLTPNTKIVLNVTEPVYHETVIGHIPSELKTENIPSSKAINTQLNSDNLKPVMAKYPEFNSDGKPVLKVYHKTFEGMGKPKVLVQKIELLKPHFSSYSYTVSEGHNGFTTYFYPNVFYTGTGFYYDKKTVEFSGGKNAEIFAVKIATMFAFLSFILFLFKIRPNPKNLIAKFKRINFDTGEDD